MHPTSASLSDLPTQSDYNKDYMDNLTKITSFPPLDQMGVPQPDVTTKDLIIIMFVLLLWIYSIFITIR